MHGELCDVQPGLLSLYPIRDHSMRLVPNNSSFLSNLHPFSRHSCFLIIGLRVHTFLSIKNLLRTHFGPLQFVRGIGLPTMSYCPFSVNLLRTLVHF